MSKMFHSALCASAAIGLGVAVLGMSSSPASACPYEPLLGAVCWSAAQFCPDNYLPADGRLLQINGNQALYSLIGPTYGGDGQATFGLPDLRGRSTVGVGNGPGLSPVTFGLKRGAEKQTLTIAQIPVHTHTAITNVAPGSGVTLQAVGNNTSASSATPSAGAYLAGVKTDSPDAVNMWSSTLTNPVNVAGLSLNLSGLSVVNGNTGGGQPVATLPPQQALTACIAINGMYPMRNN